MKLARQALPSPCNRPTPVRLVLLVVYLHIREAPLLPSGRLWALCPRFGGAS